MAIAYAEMRRIRNLEWDVGAAAPGSRRSPIEQAGLGLVAFARVLREALTGRAVGGPGRNETGDDGG
jgi:hypothetical protein